MDKPVLELVVWLPVPAMETLVDECLVAGLEL
jgi:hypothetical protein